MKSQRKHEWDEGFFMARSDPEREPKPRIESRPLRIRVNKRIGITDLERAWAALGVKFNAVHFMDHLTVLERWKRRLIRIKEVEIQAVNHIGMKNRTSFLQ